MFIVVQIIENPNVSHDFFDILPTPDAWDIQPPLSAPPLSRLVRAQPSNTPPATATAPVRKVKKRKTLNLEALAQTDVQSLLPKKQTTLQRTKGQFCCCIKNQLLKLPTQTRLRTWTLLPRNFHHPLPLRLFKILLSPSLLRTILWRL